MIRFSSERERMGLLLYPEFQKEVPGLKENSTGEFLIRVVELLDEIAEELTLTPRGIDSSQYPYP
jgi:hypothetical protein